jgi:hypothetical protein
MPREYTSPPAAQGTTKVTAETLDATGFDGVQLPCEPLEFVVNRIRMTNMIIRVLTSNFPSLVARGTPIVLMESLIIEEILWGMAKEVIEAYEDMSTMAARLEHAVKVRADIVREAQRVVAGKPDAKKGKEAARPTTPAVPDLAKPRKLSTAHAAAGKAVDEKVLRKAAPPHEVSSAVLRAEKQITEQFAAIMTTPSSTTSAAPTGSTKPPPA